MPPTKTNGKVCYIEIPAVDIRRSADFYAKVFGWRIRQRGDGRLAFDDATGEVSGTWVLGRPASREPGLLVYLMVDSVAATVDVVIASGGEIVQPIGADALRDHGAIPRSRRKRDRTLPGAWCDPFGGVNHPLVAGSLKAQCRYLTARTVRLARA
jgi:uncharacterized protein